MTFPPMNETSTFPVCKKDDVLLYVQWSIGLVTLHGWNQFFNLVA